MNANRLNAWVGIGIIVAMITCFLAAYFTLASSIQWPASLNYPPEQALPLILEKSSAVFGGYYFYLFYSLLLIPAVIFAGDQLKGKDALANLLMKTAVGLAVASATFRALGIIRWEFAMLHLAGVYQDSGADPAIQAQVAMMYDVLNQYAGKVGEHLGVGLTGAMMMVFFGFSMIRSKRIWTGLYSIVAGILVLPMEDYFSFIPGFYIVIATNLFLVWLVILAYSLFSLLQENPS